MALDVSLPLTAERDRSGAPLWTGDDLVKTVGGLAEIMAASGVTELDVSSGVTTIRLRRPAPNGSPPPIEVDVGERAASEAEVPERVAPLFITAPMIGTFYAAASPSDLPFVHVGDEVEVGQTVGIIEAMKIMNEIAATHAGTVEEVLVANAQAVEFGSPLIRLAPPDGGRQ